MRTAGRQVTGLVGRFALLSLALFVLLGLALGTQLARSVERQALEDSEQLAQSLAGAVVRRHVTPEDLTSPVISPHRRDKLDREVTLALSGTAVRHVNVFDANGRVVWADRHERIGSRSQQSALLAAAFAGRSGSKLTELDGEAMLETYVPLEMPGARGAFEIYVSVAALGEESRPGNEQLALTLLTGLLAVWAAMLPLLLRTSRALRRSLTATERLARVDALTGLPNRLALQERLGDRDSSPYNALLLLDVDRFKEVNDTYGHKAGDQLLCLIGQRLAGAAGPNDLVARLGGDEFAVLLAGDQGAGQRVYRAVRELSWQYGGDRLGTTVSVGLARANPDTEPDTLLQQADIAMYSAKRRGQGLAVFEPGLVEDNAERLMLLGELREGIRAGQLRLYAQPAVRLSDGEVSGAEALVRWEHPRLGLLAPDRFVPVAEQNDLISHLTAWVLDRSVAACAEWVRDGLDLCIAVNLSSRDLVDSLPDSVEATLHRHGLDPSRLSLELTETSLPQSMETAAEVLLRLADLGVNLAVDDFGTGYATLSWLRQLTFNALKVDRSFVSDVAFEPGAEELVRHVTALAHGLHKVVVAEGVETCDQWRVLRQLGCDYAQGYGIAEPMPVAQIPAWVRACTPALPASRQPS